MVLCLGPIKKRGFTILSAYDATLGTETCICFIRKLLYQSNVNTYKYGNIKRVGVFNVAVAIGVTVYQEL